MLLNTKVLIIIGLCAISLDNCLAAEPKEKARVDDDSFTILSASGSPLVDAEQVSIALVSAAETVKEEAAKVEVPVDIRLQPVIKPSKSKQEKDCKTTNTDEQLTPKQQNPDQQQQQLGSPSSSRSIADDIVREIVVLDKETGSRYKVITVKFPLDDESSSTPKEATTDAKDVGEINAQPEVENENVDEEENVLQEAKSAVEAEEEEVVEKKAEKELEKETSKKNKKGVKKNDKKKVEKEAARTSKTGSEKSLKDINNEFEVKQSEKKRSKRSNYKKDKSHKGRGKYNDKKYKSKGKK